MKTNRKLFWDPVKERFRNDDEASLHERIKLAERSLLADTVGRMAREGWTVQGRKLRFGR